MRTLIDHAGFHTPIWVTELGWATGGPPSPFTVSPQRQAQLITRAYAEIDKHREELGIRGVVYFNWRDMRLHPGTGDFFGFHAGLLDDRGRAKPGLSAFTEAVRRLDGG